MKNLYLDLETTGPDKNRHAIYQVAGCIEIDGRVDVEFQYLMRPHEGYSWDRMAALKTGAEQALIETYPPASEFHNEIQELMGRYVDKYDTKDKFNLIGYWCQFDYDFLWKLWERMNDPYLGSWFFIPLIDVAVLTAYNLMDRRNQLKNFKLGTVCQHLGIDFNPEEAHDALYDIRKTRELFQLVRSWR